MKILYAVTHGEYSDFDVKYLCETRELAEEICGKLGSHEIREYPLVESAEDVVIRVVYHAQYSSRDRNPWREFSSIEDVTHGAADPERGTISYGYGDGSWMASAASARGPDVARKCAQDALARAKAEKAGIA